MSSDDYDPDAKRVVASGSANELAEFVAKAAKGWQP